MRMLFFILISLSASRLSHQPWIHLSIVWNVGQGQWVSVVDGSTCYHFDAGGEFFPWKKIKNLCGSRDNKISLSHWDWDHIGALADRRFSLRNFRGLCLQFRPLEQGLKVSAKKRKLLKDLPLCKESSSKVFENWRPFDYRRSNDASQVFQFKDLLLPGDSPATQEFLWTLQNLSAVRILVLGHHGSRTSTSDGLLQRLVRLKIAVSSARWRRYGHPHPEVAARLQRHHVALLRTEDWGNIWFEQ